VIRDVPGTRRHPRGQEFMVRTGVDIGTAIDVVASNRPETSYSVCVLRQAGDQAASSIAAMKSAGYRYLRSESLMLFETSRATLPTAPDGVCIRRIYTQEEADALAKFMRRRPMTPEDIYAKPQTLRVYYAEIDGSIVGYAGSVDSLHNCTYLSGMYTDPAYRRRGIARSVLSTSLVDDLAAGVVNNVLIASSAGEKLYLSMGYVGLAKLYIFTSGKQARI